MKILITGSNGFVGRNLVNYITDVMPDSTLLTPSKEVLNLVDKDSTNDYLELHQPDVVLHLAGRVGGILDNKTYPADFYFQNTMMTTLLMDLSYRHKVKRFVGLAAGCGYPDLENYDIDVPLREDQFFDGFPDMNSYGYSMAKKNMIVQSMAYREQFGFNSTVLLPANLYGPHDNFDLVSSHVVPALVRKFVEAVKDESDVVEVWGDGSASREFIYVEDVCKAIVDVANEYDKTGPLNLGTGVETTISSLVETIINVTGYKGTVKINSNRPTGQPRRVYNMDKFKNAIGSVPSISLEEGISKTVTWYKENIL
jgi:GDP-L-fucose synthase